MATPNVGILTTAGKALIDKVNSGQAKISFSKVVFSSMDNSQLSDMQVKALTAIAPQEVVVSSPETTLDTNSGETRIRATGTNEKLADGVYVKTYGVFAKDDTGSEILYGVTVSPNPNYFPAYDGVTPQAVTYSYKTVIQETSNITMTNSNDVYASQEDLTEAIAAIPLATKADDSKVVHNSGNEEIGGQKTFDTAPIDKTTGNPYITKSDLNNGLSTKVTDNHDGTEQLNGVQVQPFNKLSDTIGGRNYIATNSWIALGQYGFYTAANGSLKPGVSGSADLYSDYISISSQTMLFTWYSLPTNGTGEVHAYDATKTWIKSYIMPNAVGSTKIDLPSNTEYIAINVPNPNFRGGQSMLTVGDVKTDWSPAPEDKQDKIGYTPADDSKVLHSTATQLNSTDMNTVRTAGFYQLNSGTNGMPNVDAYAIYQVIPLSGYNGVQLAYGTNNSILGMRSWNSGNTFTSWVQFADDSKVVHNTGNEEIAGTKTFDTAPIDKTTGNPYITKDGVPAVPSTLADTTKPANFTAGLQSGGVDVATAADLKSIVGKSWLSLGTPDGTFTSPDGSTDIGTFVGTPLLMKFDATTGITKFMGNFRVETTHNNTTWKGSVFQIPGGFTVTNPESLLNLLVDVPWSIMGTLTSCHLDGQNIMATIKKDASNSSYTRGIVFSGLGSASGYPQVGKSKTTALITRI